MPATGKPDDGGPTQQVKVDFNFGDVTSDIITFSPSFAGKQRVQGYSLNLGYTLEKHDWLGTLNFSSNRNNAQIRNLFTGGQDIATSLGIYNDDFKNPINTNPMNYGLPSLILNNLVEWCR